MPKTLRGQLADAEKELRTLAVLNNRRTWRTLPFGSLGPAHAVPSPASVQRSRTETNYTNLLMAYGFPIRFVQYTVPNLINPRQPWTMNPDITIGTVAIEFDFAVTETLTGHNKGFPADDLYRADCLSAVGVPSIHVRADGLQSVPDYLNIHVNGRNIADVVRELVTCLDSIYGTKTTQDRSRIPEMPLNLPTTELFRHFAQEMP